MMNHEYFARKVPGYFDGTLRDGEKTELEAYIGTHADFAEYFRQKEAEQHSLKMRVPNVELDAGTSEQLESEVRETINNLFRDDEASFSKRVGDWLKEKI